MAPVAQGMYVRKLAMSKYASLNAWGFLSTWLMQVPLHPLRL
jgi:hypothetical protein